MVSITCNTYNKMEYLSCPEHWVGKVTGRLAQPCFLVMTNNIDEDVARREIRA